MKIPYTNIQIGKQSIPQDITRKRPRRANIEDKLQRIAFMQTRKDIQDWNKAVNRARSFNNPSRTQLMDIYRDISIDGHLTGIVTSIKRMIKSKEFQLVNSEGDIQEDLIKNFEKKWFDDYLDYAVDSFFYGYSLVGLGNIVDDYFDSVHLVPREHVVPELGKVKRNKYGSVTDQSIDFTKPPYKLWYILQGGADKNLGMYNNVAPHAIGKKNLLIQAWDNAELYGTPMRIIKTDVDDEARRQYAEKALKSMGSNAAGVIDENDDLMLQDRQIGDAYKTFLEPYRLSNEEISKSIAGQTMMFDDGSSRSQSEVHERLFNSICISYALEIGYNINRELLPRMTMLGMAYEGITYEWVEKEYLSLNEKVENMAKLANGGFVFKDGFAEEYTGLKVEQSINLGLEKDENIENKYKEIFNLYKK